MSEEEIIKYLSIMEKEYKKFGDLYNPDYEDADKIHKAIQGLLDLYNKEKEKNKELEQRINKAIAFINNDDVYFTDGESWENVLYIESVLKGE